MILLILIWIYIFLILFITGFSIEKIIHKFSGKNEYVTSLDEYFFLGFMSLSPVLGFFSIWFPVGTNALLIVTVSAIILSIINFKDLRKRFRDLSKELSLFKISVLILIFIYILIILTLAVQKITWSDTALYHAQSIKWIREYSVVPGLGNIHGRFAFNSMFLVISALFTFHLKDIVIFPLNALCYTVLSIKMITLIFREYRDGNIWKPVFYFLILMTTLFTMSPLLNSASPDFICGVLVIYTFILVMDKKSADQDFNYMKWILLSLLVLNCITYKISTLFLLLALLPGINKDFTKKAILIFIAGFITLAPYIIRNFYLSGYLIYPFPAIDIFNVDWKIPYAQAVNEKVWIVSWARNVPVESVFNQRIDEWIVPWFKSNNLANKLILSINALSIFTLIIMIIRKDLLYAGIQIIILLNLIFWFIMAPDPRFASGFLITGLSLTIAYIIKLIENRGNRLIITLWMLIGCCFILYDRGSYTFSILKNPSQFLFPAPFEIAETKTLNSGFDYKLPVRDVYCYYSDIPCVPLPLINVKLRGDSLKDGFRTVKGN